MIPAKKYSYNLLYKLQLAFQSANLPTEISAQQFKIF